MDNEVQNAEKKILAAGGTITQGMIRFKKNVTVMPDVIDAINYLVVEWDYGYERK